MPSKFALGANLLRIKVSSRDILHELRQPEIFNVPSLNGNSCAKMFLVSSYSGDRCQVGQASGAEFLSKGFGAEFNKC